ncbi:MAG: hypothetical protein KDB27_23345 [Planctomycetales bacterium]|nr:hypothetical protein [Planctomycetales bacterium]
MRSRPDIPLASDLNLFSWSGPKPSDRTLQFLRRHDLVDELDGDMRVLVEQVQEIAERRPMAEHVYASSEIAFIAGKQLEDEKKLGDALDLYGTSVAQAYMFLLSDEFDNTRNPYDPIFRRASDLYNGALESAMRVANQKGKLKPGEKTVIRTATNDFEIRVVTRGKRRPEDFDHLEFVSDYKLTGLKNLYRTYGLGVPLIAVHSRKASTDRADPSQEGDNRDAATRYYAPGMAFPVTAFLRVIPDATKVGSDGKRKHFCELELYDPLDGSDIVVNNRLVPLETDLTTPLAFSLNDPTFQRANTATRGLIDPVKSSEVQGLYMLEPYDPDKIPVLMVHGLWSNLITWMEMFNDLRGTREIRDSYQFWFYLYPTGQPFWETAAQLRQELAEAKDLLDPQYANPALDEMILVGHSMGGLIARLQTLESGDDFWNLISDGSIDDIDASDELKRKLADAMYFHPDRSIKRVVTIASPHRGSNLSNDATQWLGRKLINLPKSVAYTTERLLKDNKEVVKAETLRKMQTSIDTLAPDSPILPVMLQAQSAPWTKYHNVVGLIPEEKVFSRVAGESDGVVTVESAHLDDVESEVTVESDHGNVHRHPRAILEVQRILLMHLAENRNRHRQQVADPKLTGLPKIDRSQK